ncbi:hypothetical protein ACQPUL_02415 [Clostridium butyricum]|uniref:hypothetical protein n=1 Tax=Clostridium butyricum TaxID=1492 RepID=UPI003D33F8DD
MMKLIEERIYDMVKWQMLTMNGVVAEDDNLTDEDRKKLVYDIERFDNDEVSRNKVIKEMKEVILSYFLVKLDELEIDETFNIENEIFYEYGGIDAYYEHFGEE